MARLSWHFEALRAFAHRVLLEHLAEHWHGALEEGQPGAPLITGIQLPAGEVLLRVARDQAQQLPGARSELRDIPLHRQQAPIYRQHDADNLLLVALHSAGMAPSATAEGAAQDVEEPVLPGSLLGAQALAVAHVELSLRIPAAGFIAQLLQSTPCA
eukprot:CAMPEP_0181415622 /NCGR_PEP_ID=MMETSP1110-20121109/10109_1 /TAXON_ID=174948 /ORGANISM="Symbiodinium sp., Strain CCMP421" /LENGTH=156 /DNA_ID=CAMNT_0023538525 /DNA_START=59 /DNA_END=529 /DNA_ORIENTATION=-